MGKRTKIALPVTAELRRLVERFDRRHAEETEEMARKWGSASRRSIPGAEERVAIHVSRALSRAEAAEKRVKEFEAHYERQTAEMVDEERVLAAAESALSASRAEVERLRGAVDPLVTLVMGSTVPMLRDVIDDLEHLGHRGLANSLREERELLHRHGRAARSALREPETGGGAG